MRCAMNGTRRLSASHSVFLYRDNIPEWCLNSRQQTARLRVQNQPITKRWPAYHVAGDSPRCRDIRHLSYYIPLAGVQKMQQVFGKDSRLGNMRREGYCNTKGIHAWRLPISDTADVCAWMYSVLLNVKNLKIVQFSLSNSGILRMLFIMMMIMLCASGHANSFSAFATLCLHAHMLGFRLVTSLDTICAHSPH